MCVFRLSSVLVGILITTSVVSAEGNTDESKAVTKIELLGGKVTRDVKRPGRPVTGVDFQGSKHRRINDRYLHLLQAFPHLTSLDLSGTAITDAGLT